MKKYRISFIGAGKVAYALCLEMHKSGIKIQKIVSRTEQNCRELAELCNASWSLDLNFDGRTDIIILTVPDDSIKTVSKKIKCQERTIVVHTAGSIGLNVFPAGLEHRGVLYPLQTFSAGRIINFSQVPFFIEGSDPSTSKTLKELAESLGGTAHFINSEKRRLLHLSAVFVNNFTNFMLIAGKEIVSKAGLEFDVLIPLIKETVLKAYETGPEKSQTGPAVRSDLETIKSHIKLLSFSPDLQNIYREITESIISFDKKHIND